MRASLDKELEEVELSTDPIGVGGGIKGAELSQDSLTKEFENVRTRGLHNVLDLSLALVEKAAELSVSTFGPDAFENRRSSDEGLAVPTPGVVNRNSLLQVSVRYCRKTIKMIYIRAVFHRHRDFV